MAKFDRRLGKILLAAELLDKDSLGKAMDIANKESKSLATVVLEHQMVEERAFVSSVAQNMNIPPVDVSRAVATDDALGSLPQDMALYYGVLPLAKIGNVLTMAVANPFDILKLDDVKIVTGCDIRPVVSTEPAIRQAIEKSYSRGEAEMEQLFEDMGDPELEYKGHEDDDDEDFDLSELTGSSEDSPVVKLVNLLISQAVRQKVSDIHIEPFEKKLRVRYRADGKLHETLSPPKAMQSAIASRIKIMADLDIAKKRRPQDGKFQIRLDGRNIDFRVSVLPTIHGEKVVLRILDSGNLALSLKKLGFEEKALLEDFRKAIVAPYGMILVTGPTGSGKSTTLYSSLSETLNIEDNVVTVEDPVEYQLEGVNQVPVNVKRGLTFAAALRSILRQDPDTVMIGEIRDKETVEIAIKAALTGHLVLSTLHTNDAPSTVTRMLDMEVDPFMVASATVLVSAQRLARRLCKECREEVEMSKDALIRLGDRDGLPEGMHLYRSVGCNRCSGGYRGRFALLKTMPMTEDMKRVIIDGGSVLDIKDKALKEGMVTLRRCGLLNAFRGNTSLEEVIKVTMAD